MYQQQLPMLPNQIQVPFMALSGQYPPMVPATIRTDPAMAHLIPTVAAYAAFQVQRAVQEQPQNPLRVFMYNMCAVSAWNNPEFEALVAACVDFLWAGVVNQRIATPEAGLQQACDQMIEMVRAAYLLKFPALAQYCDPTLLNNAQGLLQAFQQAISEIQSTKARMGGQAAMYGQGAMGGGPYVQGGQRMPGGGFAWQAAVNTQSTALPSGAGASVFSGGNRAPVSGGQSGNFGAASRYDQSVVQQPQLVARPATSNPTPQPQEVSVQLQPPVATAEEQLIPIEQIKWVPNQTYPHPPAYNPELHAVFVKQEPTGELAPVVKKKDTVVDFTRHAVGTFGSRPKNLDLSKRVDTLERLQSGIAQINQQTAPETAEGEQPAKLPFSSLIRSDVVTEVSNDAAWLVAGLERLTRRVDDKIPDIYRLHAKIYQAVVGMQNETAFVRGFAACETFIELREKLNASVNRVSPTLWSVANTRMTQAINRAVRENLSLPGLSIDSFVDDIEDLQKLLENRYGELLLSSLNKHQAAMIRRTFGSFSDEESTVEASSYLLGDYEAAEAPKITFVCSNVSFTVLNCWSYELNLELAAKTSAVLSQSLTPMMYQLVKGIFDAQSTLEFESEHGEFDTHLIRTLDNRVLEAQRGFINDDYFVLTLVE